MINTNKVGEDTSEIRGSGSGGEGDVGSYDDFALNETEDEDFERILRDGIEDESSNRPATYENSCQGKRPSVAVIVALAHQF